LTGTGAQVVRHIKDDPSKAASKATQHLVWGAMHFSVAVGYLVFVHPAHHVLLVRWLPGMAYLFDAQYEPLQHNNLEPDGDRVAASPGALSPEVEFP
jgi:hypothetical protein